MEGILKLLRSLGLSEAEIRKVLERVPVNPQGLTGTNVAKAIFEKGGKEAIAEYPLLTETMVSPFKLNKYKGLSKERALQEAEKAIDYLDQELSRTSNLVLNENLKLTKEQEINFANNLRMKRNFEKEVEEFKAKPEAKVIPLNAKQPLQRNVEDALKEQGIAQLSYSRMEDEGLVRAAARQILMNDIKAGKIKNMSVSEVINMKEPLDPFRQMYGEGALEQLDSLIPEFRNLKTEMDAEKLARSKFKFEPDEARPREYLTKEETDKMLKDAPEYSAPKELTDDEMLAYIKNYKEKGPTLEEYTKKFNEEHGTNLKPDDLEQAHRVKTAYPHSTPIVDEKGKFIGGRLDNPPKDYDLSDRETLTNSILATRRANGQAKSNPLPADKEYEKKLQEEALKKESERAGQGRFTKQHVLKRIIQSTIDANPTDKYVQKTFPGFLKEITDNPELANNPTVWKSFTEGLPENQRLVVYGDDTVDFFTKGGPGSMTQVQELMDKHKIPYDKALRIKQMEPEDQVLEIKKLETLKAREEEGAKGLDYLTGGEGTKKPEPEGKAEGGIIRKKYARAHYAEGTPSIKLPDEDNTDTFGKETIKLPEQGIEGLRFGFIDKRKTPMISSGGLRELKENLLNTVSRQDPMIGYGSDNFNAYVAKGLNPYSDRDLRYGASYRPNSNKDAEFFIEAAPGFKAAGYGMTKDDTNFSLYGTKDTSTGAKNLQLKFKKDLPVGWSNGLDYLTGE